VVYIVHYYGAQSEKVGALYYILVYTGAFGISFIYILILLEMWSLYVSPMVRFFMLGIFAVKCPVYVFHLWLPKAHVEAPTTASMLLAGLLLKVGLYGSIKVVVVTNMRYFWVLCLSFLGYIIAPILSIISRETKHIVAYSSVAHINIALNGVLFVCRRLNSRSYLVSLSHGYISTVMFYMVGEISHGRGTRIVYYTSGLMCSSGFVIFVCGIILLANAGVPPFLSFWGELIVVGSITRFEILFSVSILIYFLLSFYYSVFLLIRIIKGGGVKLLYVGIRVTCLVGIIPLVYIIFYIL